MPSAWFLYSYLTAGVAALVLLVLFGAQRWYLHALSMFAGLLAGMVPPFGGLGGDWFYLVAGTGCVFLLVWGAAGLLLCAVQRLSASPSECLKV